MAFSLPALTHRYHPSGLHGLGAFGMLGDIPIAGWSAGTLIQYSNPDLMGNTFFSYTNEEIQAAFAATGLFIPSTVTFHAENITFLGVGNGYSVSLSGVIPVDVSQSDVSKVIEGLLANWFNTNPGAASYYPPPNATLNVTPTGQVTSSKGIGQATLYTSAKPASQYGIIEAGSYADGTTYVAFNDGNTINFDNQGNPLFGIPYGAYGVNFAIAYDDGSTGVVLADGTELDFDSTGHQIMPGTSTPVGLLQPVQTVKTTTTTISPTGTVQVKPGASTGSGVDWSKILSTVGLQSLPVALGVSAGAVVIGGAVLLYFYFSGSGGGRRR